MTRRFDRLKDGKKMHMQSLCALAHYDLDQAGIYSYEQVFQIIRKLELPMASAEQQFRRMVLNIAARNHDDHAKNIAFLMDERGKWSLAPAFDITYSYNPAGTWTACHQMTMNGKRDGFTLEDFATCAVAAKINERSAAAIVREVMDVVSRWHDYAEQAGVVPFLRQLIGRNLRLL
jgi:serine/threonine-protein kinase HipA